MRIRLLLTDRTASVCYIVSAAVILAVLLSLNIHAEEKSAIPIGLIDEDRSETSKELCRRLGELPSLYIYEGSMEELTELLLDGYVNSIYVIEQGYEDRVNAADTAELICVTYSGDDRISSLICDIFAGCMMYDICLNKTYAEYESLDRSRINADVTSGDADDTVMAQKLTKSEYAAYLQNRRASGEFEFTFDVTYTEAGSGEIQRSDITNGMLYRQMIAAILAMLIMLVCFCGYNVQVTEYENGLRSRLKTVMSGPGCCAAEILAVSLYTAPLAVPVSLLLTADGGIGNFFGILLVNLVFILVSGAIFRLLAGLAGGTFTYQLLGTAVTLILGISGFVSVFEGLMGISVLQYTPVAVYISELIQNGGI